jgi:hypothetical protein
MFPLEDVSSDLAGAFKPDDDAHLMTARFWRKIISVTTIVPARSSKARSAGDPWPIRPEGKCGRPPTPTYPPSDVAPDTERLVYPAPLTKIIETGQVL